MRSLVWSIVLVACSSPARPPAEIVVAPPSVAPVAPPVVADPPPPALRMPGDVKPLRYALDLTVVPSAVSTAGHIAIAAEVLRPTRIVWLNATDIAITSATLGGAKARVVTGNVDFIGLSVDRELLGPLAIDVQFTSQIDKIASRGIYSAKEAGEGADNDYVYTFFEPIDARRAFPCFDEPSAKVPWQLTFHVKANHVALGNAPVVKETPEDNGMKRVELAETPPLPSYLVAFMVGPFEIIDGGSAGRVPTPIRFVIPKGRAGELGYAKRVTPKVVKALEDYFAMNYPFQKLDVAVVPRFWGTMEHPGIVAMGQPLTLIRPDQEVFSRKWAYANILSHELGHYWFGDYVTMAWWNDSWLNEAFGQWLDLIITHAAEPTFRALDRRIAGTDYAMTGDETLNTRAMRVDVTTRDGIQSSFDNGVTYDKGSALFRMFEAAVGKEKWRSAMQTYLKAHAWGNATSEELLASLAASLGAPTAAALRTFLDQPGVPKITAKLVCARGAAPKLELAQRRSLPADTKETTARLWSVPVCVRYGGAASQQACTRLDGAKGELVLGKATDPCPTWIVLNANATGYYRSVLDPAQTKAMFEAGKVRTSAKPTVQERLMMAMDLRAMSRRDDLGIDTLLGLAPAIAADADPMVAKVGVELSMFTEDALTVDRKARAVRYRVKTFGPLLTELGWTRAKTDTDERHVLRRSVIYAIGADVPAAVTKANALADTWLATKKGVDDELVEVTLATSNAHGDAARFARVLAAAKAGRDHDEQARILSSLGAFRDPALLAQALALTLDPSLDLRDTIGIFQTALWDRVTQPAAQAFAKAHLDELLGRMRDDEASWLLESLSNTCTPASLVAMRDLVEPRAKKYAGSETPVRRGLEKSQQCIAKTERQMPALTKFLAPY